MEPPRAPPSGYRPRGTDDMAASFARVRANSESIGDGASATFRENVSGRRRCRAVDAEGYALERRPRYAGACARQRPAAARTPGGPGSAAIGDRRDIGA